LRCSFSHLGSFCLFAPALSTSGPNPWKIGGLKKVKSRPEIKTATQAPSDVPAINFARKGASLPAGMALTSAKALER
jgi:hypothetical protein